MSKKINNKKRNAQKMAKLVKANIAQLIRQSRKQKGYSQTRLAELIGVDRKTINRIENEHFSPSVENLVKIFHILEIKFQKAFVA